MAFKLLRRAQADVNAIYEWIAKRSRQRLFKTPRGRIYRILFVIANNRFVCCS